MTSILKKIFKSRLTRAISITCLLLLLACVLIAVPKESQISAQNILGTTQVGRQYGYAEPVVTQTSTRNWEIKNTSAGTSIKIGSGTSTFANKVLFSAFDGEATFSLNLPLGTFTANSMTGSGVNSKVTLQNTNYSISYAPTAPKVGFNELGGIDWIITANRKLATVPTSFSFTLANVVGVTPYLQPSLTKEFTVGQLAPNKDATIATVTDSTVTDSNGKVIASRPDYVVNSIAFYSNKSGDYTAVAGKNYSTGKVGQLYRMRATDNLGKTAWLDWNVDNSTTISLNDTTGFLQTATYPVTIAPVGDTFGYINTGASSACAYSKNKFQSEGNTYTPAVGTALSMSIYGRQDGASGNVQMALYTYTSDEHGTKLTNGVTPSVATSTTIQWYTSTFATPPTLSAVAYYLCYNYQIDNFYIYYDTGATRGIDSVGDTFGTWTTPIVLTNEPSLKWKYSIYVTYIPSASPWTIQPPTKDTYLSQYAPTTNYGTATALYLYNRSSRADRAILEFNTLAMPAGQTISSAELDLYYYAYSGANPSGLTVDAYKLSQTAWVEGQATWNIYSTGNNWSSAGGDYVTSNPAGGSVAVPANYGWVEWDVTAIVQDAYTNSALTEILLKFDTEGVSSGYARADFYSNNYATGANRPKLTITYAPSASAPTVTLSAASSVAATTATLNGQITNLNGNASATVTVYYGTTDHQGTATGWDSSHAPDEAQPQGVAAFSLAVSGLSTGTTYWFTAKAVGNVNGTGWVTPTDTSFLTIPDVPTNVAATDGTYPDKVTITWTKSTGATKYKVLRGAVNDSGDLGDVATYDDTAGAASTITPGTATATDGTSTSYVTLTLSGQSASNGSTESYTVYAGNTTGYSSASSSNNGYKGTTTLTYQW